MKGALIALGVAGTFGSGFIYGAICYQRAVKKRLELATPLIHNMMKDIYMNRHVERMTIDQFEKKVKEELDFVKIVVGDYSK